MNVELMFDKHAAELNRFDRIPVHEKLDFNQAVCALKYILKLSIKKDTTTIDFEFSPDRTGASMSHQDLNIDCLTEDNVIYLLRCGVTYDSSGF